MDWGRPVHPSLPAGVSEVDANPATSRGDFSGMGLGDRREMRLSDL